MYKIPKSFDISVLKNEIISQIAFGLNFVTLFFSKGFIQIEGEFATIFENQLFEYAEIYPVKNDFGLLHLLEQKIIEINVSNDRSTLELVFESGFSLKLKGNEAFESYRIKINDEEVVV